MLQLQFLRDQKAEAIERLKKRNFKDLHLINDILDIDEKRRRAKNELDNVLAEINKISKEIGELYGKGMKSEGDLQRNRVSELKNISRELDEEWKSLEIEIQNLLIKIPNTPHLSVPEGKSAEDNLIIREGGSTPQLIHNKKSHWELGAIYNIIDFDLGSKLTGSGFPVFKNKGAKLQRALINFFIDKALEKGYSEVIPPLLVNSQTAFGTGQLPDKEGQMYYATEDDLYLIPTAEVPVTNIYRDVIVKEDEFPVKMVAYTPCFRREAGSYGKEVRGLNRVHQFDKVEIVQIEHPDKSYETLESMVEHVEELLNLLKLPYRILKLCGGDMGFSSALTYDFEVFSAGQEMWLEVSSVSNFETFQSNRMQIRFKEDNKMRLVHTLNGSALALPRIIAALLENYQQDDFINIPEVLVPYTGFDKILNV